MEHCFDHHLEGCPYGSTVEILHQPEGLARLHAWLRETENGTRMVMTHPAPDLDAVTSCATVLRIAHGETPLHERLVAWINRQDQGFADAASPDCCPATLFEVITRGLASDHARLKAGLRLIELLQNACVEMAYHPCQTHLTHVPGLRAAFPEALRRLSGLEAEYTQRLQDARRFLASNPVEKGDKVRGIWLRLPADAPPGFKNWLRHRMEVDPDGMGRILVIRWLDANLPQLVISCAPATGLDLRTWGALLDRLESQKSRELESNGQITTEPVSRIAKARGRQNASSPTFQRQHHPPRPGFENNDPWYDGRGHLGTILDSPRSGTVLADKDVWNALDFSAEGNPDE